MIISIYYRKGNFTNCINYINIFIIMNIMTYYCVSLYTKHGYF